MSGPDHLGQGIPEADILREYPRLEPEDIRAALTYAAFWRKKTSSLCPLPPNHR